MRIGQWPFGDWMRLFLTVIALVLLPLVILFAININIVNQNIHQIAQGFNADLLRQTSTAMDNIIDLVEGRTQRFFSDEAAMAFFSAKSKQPSFDYYTMLANARTSMTRNTEEVGKYVNKVAFYNMQTDTLLYTSGSEQSIGNPARLETIELLYQQNPYGNTWLQDEAYKNLFFDDGDAITMIRFVFQNMKRSGVIAIQFNIKQFEAVMNDVYIHENGYIAITDADGRPLANNELQTHPLMEDIQAHLRYGEESFTIHGGGVLGTFLVTAVSAKSNGWKYLSILPASTLDDSARVVTGKVMMVYAIGVLILLMACLTLSRGVNSMLLFIYGRLRGDDSKSRWISSKMLRFGLMSSIDHEIGGLYSRLDDAKINSDVLLLESDLLKRRYNDSIAQINTVMLRAVLLGAVKSESIDRVAEMFDLTEATHFCVVVMHCEQEPFSRESETSLGLMISELSEQTDLSEQHLIDEENARLLLLLSDRSDASVERFEQSVEEFLQYLQNNLTETHGFAIGYTVGETVDRLANVAQSYAKALHAMEYEVTNGVARQAYFTAAEEYIARIQHSLSAHDIQCVLHLLTDFKDFLSGGSMNRAAALYYMESVMHDVLRYLEQNKDRYPHEAHNFYGIFADFNRRFQSVEQAARYLDEYLLKLAHIGQPIPNMLAIRTTSIIHNEYQSEISLHDIANRLNVSVPHLSRVFKESTGKNFKEYLIECRIENAKKLLVRREMSVAEISAAVGYTDARQFSRIYKKYVGMTPAQYRLSSMDRGE